MKAMILPEIKSALVQTERLDLKPQAGEVVVSLLAAALNRRDFWITQGKYPGIQTPIVLGSDGCGIVVEIGAGVADEWKGKTVIINPGWFWGDKQTSQSADFQILGLPHDGTLAEQILVPCEMLHLKPDYLSDTEAAALPLAGVTAYRALFSRAKLVAGEKVLITGAGGGVSTFLIQFATAVGAEVFVTSSSSEKIQQAIELGAVAGFIYTHNDWAERLQEKAGSIDVVIDSAAGANYNRLIDIASFGGRIVNYGATAGAPERMDIFKVYWKQLSLLGSTMGSPDDFQAMLDFVTRHLIKPIIDSVFQLAEVNSALEQMKVSSQFGKLVVKIE